MIPGMSENVVLIIQARMGSTRLPGKVLMPILDRPMMAYQIERLQRVESVHSLVVATSDQPADQPIVDLCRRLNVDVFRGSENDVLKRYYDAATEYQADVVVRSTADCPLIDPEVTDQLIQVFLDGQYVYGSNSAVRPTYPHGLDVEVMTYEALQKSHRESTRADAREHVTSDICDIDRVSRLTPTELERAGILNMRLLNEDFSQHRWTVDYADDFNFVKRVYEALYVKNPKFNFRDVLAWCELTQVRHLKRQDQLSATA